MKAMFSITPESADKGRDAHSPVLPCEISAAEFIKQQHKMYRAQLQHSGNDGKSEKSRISSENRVPDKCVQGKDLGKTADTLNGEPTAINEPKNTESPCSRVREECEDMASYASSETTEGADPPDMLDSDLDIDDRLCPELSDRSKVPHEGEEEDAPKNIVPERPQCLKIQDRDEDKTSQPAFIPGVDPLHLESNCAGRPTGAHSEMVSFVAKDLEAKIRLSSPPSRDENTSPASVWSMSSSLYSNVNSPTMSRRGNALPPVDHGVLDDLESQARHVADNLHLLMGNLTAQLHNMSALTVGCLQTYNDSVNKTCDTIDASIKSMYTLMAKCEELSKGMQPVQKLREEIIEVNRLLDLFEAGMSSKHSKRLT